MVVVLGLIDVVVGMVVVLVGSCNSFLSPRVGEVKRGEQRCLPKGII